MGREPDTSLPHVHRPPPLSAGQQRARRRSTAGGRKRPDGVSRPSQVATYETVPLGMGCCQAARYRLAWGVACTGCLASPNIRPELPCMGSLPVRPVLRRRVVEHGSMRSSGAWGVSATVAQRDRRVDGDLAGCPLGKGCLPPPVRSLQVKGPRSLAPRRQSLLPWRGSKGKTPASAVGQFECRVSTQRRHWLAHQQSQGPDVQRCCAPTVVRLSRAVEQASAVLNTRHDAGVVLLPAAIGVSMRHAGSPSSNAFAARKSGAAKPSVNRS